MYEYRSNVCGQNRTNDSLDSAEICATFGNNGVKSTITPPSPAPPSTYHPSSIKQLSHTSTLHLYNNHIHTMFRSVILRAPLRAASFALARPSVVIRPAPIALARGYAASAGLAKDDISSRVLEVMKTFEKVDGGKVGPVLVLVRIFNPAAKNCESVQVYNLTKLVAIPNCRFHLGSRIGLARCCRGRHGYRGGVWRRDPRCRG